MRLLGILAFLTFCVVILPAFSQLEEADHRERLLVEVTGDPAPADFVVWAVRRAFAWTYSGDPTLVFLTTIQDLSYGAEMYLRVKVQGRTAAGTTVVKVFPVTVRNVTIPWQDAGMLFVSNSPETLAWTKGLFRGSLGLGEVARLLYHHRNGVKGRPMHLVVRVANPSPRPARIWVSDAHAGPVRAALYAGHAAASRWLRLYWSETGQILEIPGHTTRPLSEVILPPDHVGSGILQVRLLQGKGVVLDVAGLLEGDLEPAQESYLINRDTKHLRGVFPSPRRDLVVNYESTSPTPVIIGGKDHQNGPPLGEVSHGTYGVIYTIRVNLFNPSTHARQAVVRATALAGPAMGTFLVDRDVVGVSLVQSGVPQTLATIRLEPLERRMVFVSTMPEAGSTYPIQMVFSPR